MFKGLFSEKISHRPPETAFVLEQSITCAGLIKSSWFFFVFFSKFPKSNSKKNKFWGSTVWEYKELDPPFELSYGT